jgi:hypothetical protein
VNAAVRGPAGLDSARRLRNAQTIFDLEGTWTDGDARAVLEE